MKSRVRDPIYLRLARRFRYELGAAGRRKVALGRLRFDGVKDGRNVDGLLWFAKFKVLIS